ncbi:MAG TPA: sigma-70 family RNA polymerase sigma factor [Phycisphaerales bacterium]|nr:sigma-70 family RNA polymerase sigma factor [Phycisphaerales bacterium]
MAEPPMATARSAAPARPGNATASAAGTSPILDLLRQSGRGEGRAIGRVYELRFDRVFLAARRATGRGEDFCLDVVQETFLRVLRSGSQTRRLRDEDHAERWLAAVTRSVALDLLRAEQRRERRERGAARGESASTGRGPPDSLIASLEHELRQLPAEDRELLHLRATGMTLAGIAEFVGSTIGSVHGRLRRLTGTLASRKDEHHG